MSVETGYAIAHAGELERTGRWQLVRRSLGIRAFGCNLVDLEPGYALPEHDEVERDQEELFVVLAGDVVAVIDGREHPASAGTFVRVDPPLRRTIRNDSDAPASVLIVSAPQSSGFAPLDWA